jgi:multiple sugar transport system permease protein
MTAKQAARWKKDLVGWSFCIVPVLVFAVFVVYPLIMAFYLSFTDYNLIKFSWIGVKNYTDWFTIASRREMLLRSILNVLYYTVLVIPLTMIPPLILAGVLHNKLRGSKIYRVLLYVPALTGSVATALMWSWLFNVAYSPINIMMRSVGLPEFSFLSSAKTAMLTLVMMVAWTGMGGTIVIFSAALQTVPGEYYEAARIDGASAPRQFISVTLPMLMPTLYFLITMSIIGSLQLFDSVYLLTNGGPEGATQTPAYLIYVISFESARKAGFGSALAVILFFVVMVVTFLFQKLTKEQLF